MALFNVDVDAVADVLAIRQAAITNLKNGLTVMSWSSEGSSANSTFTLPVEVVLKETLAYLQKYDPALYGTSVKKAKAYFV